VTIRDRLSPVDGEAPTYFCHPALDRQEAYILPMAPMPIRPIAGCSSDGEDGATSGEIMLI
jgi:hypothetical protein